MAVMVNRLDKAAEKLNSEATPQMLKTTERFISNIDAEIESIRSQDINEFNLKITILQDFELLCALSEELKEEIPEVTDFISMFSLDFTQAQTLDEFKDVSVRMRTNIILVKKQLGMPIDDIPVQEEVLPVLEKPKTSG
jgi:hypothetical protein